MARRRPDTISVLSGTPRTPPMRLAQPDTDPAGLLFVQQPHSPACSDLQCDACYVWVNGRARRVLERVLSERDIRGANGLIIRSETSHIATYTERL